MRIIYDAATSISIPDIFALKLSTGNLILSGALSIKTSVPTPPLITTNLVLHLDANSYSGSGKWLDESSSGNDGTITSSGSGLTYVSAGNASYFNSVSYTHLTLPTNREV